MERSDRRHTVIETGTDEGGLRRGERALAIVGDAGIRIGIATFHR
jgi:hypothetical protein